MKNCPFCFLGFFSNDYAVIPTCVGNTNLKSQMKLKPNRFLRTQCLSAIMAAAFTTLSAPCADAKPRDIDADGIANRVDSDVDGDGITNGDDRNVDGGVCKRGPKKGKYVGDRAPNGSAREKDIDDDGLDDDSLKEKDIDGDGLPDDSKREKDIDGDGKPDDSDDDIDGDDTDNDEDDDCDGDGKGRGRDDDDDGDGEDDDSDDDDDNDGIDDDSDDDGDELEIGLTKSVDSPAGSRVRVKISKTLTGEIELEFDGRNLAEGTYDVVVNGTKIGELEMEKDKDRTEGEVEFETTPDDDDENALPFDPSGLPVEIKQGSTVFFSGTIPTPA
jgi:hypothetical protein